MAFNVRDFGAFGVDDDDVDDTNALNAAISAAQAVHGTVIIPAGTYRYTQLNNLGNVDNFSIVGVGGRPVLKHTGSNIAFDINGDPTNGGTKAFRSWNIRVENITILGNANTTIGFRFKHTHHGIFRNLRVLSMGLGAPSAAFQMAWTTKTLYEQLVCTANEENSAGSMPLKGIEITAGVTNTQGNTFINPIIEGLVAPGAVGIDIVNGSRNWFYGGSSEGNTKNVQVSNISGGNTFNGIYLEDAKSAVHVSDHGQWTHWINCLADARNVANVVTNFNIESDAKHTVVLGGQIGNLVVNAGAADAHLTGVTVETLTNNGTRTHCSGVYDSDAALQLGNFTGASLRVGGNVNFVTDNANDIGGNGITRPRDVYVGRRVILQGAAPALEANNTAVNGTVAVTLGSTGPTGSTAGAPRGWLPISVNGVTRYIPFW